MTTQELKQQEYKTFYEYTGLVFKRKYYHSFLLADQNLDLNDIVPDGEYYCEIRMYKKYPKNK